VTPGPKTLPGWSFTWGHRFRLVKHPRWL